MNSQSRSLALLALLVAPAAAAAQNSYALTEIIPPSPGLVTQAFSINDLGEVGVSTGDTTSVGNAWVIGPAGARALPALPGDPAAIPLRLCRTGRALGGSGDSSLEPMRAARWSAAGVVGELRGLPGSLQSLALDSNGESRIVGYSATVPGFEEQPLLWDHGVRIQLDLPAGLDFGEALGINTRGQIVGAGWDSSFILVGAWVRDGLAPPAAVPLLPGYLFNQLNDINSAGMAVGASLRADGETLGLVWHHGASLAVANPSGVGDVAFISVGRDAEAVGVGTELATGLPEAVYFDGAASHRLDALLDSTGLGWDLLVANEINSSGAIVATGFTPGGSIGACLLTPSPADHGAPAPVARSIGAGERAAAEHVLRRALLGKGPLAQRLLSRR